MSTLNLKIDKPSYNIGDKIYYISNSIVYKGTIIKAYINTNSEIFTIATESDYDMMTISSPSYSYYIQDISATTYSVINQESVFVEKINQNPTISTVVYKGITVSYNITDGAIVSYNGVTYSVNNVTGSSVFYTSNKNTLYMHIVFYLNTNTTITAESKDENGNEIDNTTMVNTLEVITAEDDNEYYTLNTGRGLVDCVIKTFDIKKIDGTYLPLDIKTDTILLDDSVGVYYSIDGITASI